MSGDRLTDAELVRSRLMPNTEYARNMGEREHAAMRARLGMPVSPPPRMRLDLIGRGRRVKREPIAAPALPPKPKPAAMIIMSPLYRFGWPVYVRPVFYDQYDGIPLVLPPATWRTIARDVCKKHGVSMEELLSPRRATYIVRARHEAFWRCRNETSLSYPQIGQRFGGKDHTTVLHGIRMHEKRMREAANG